MRSKPEQTDAPDAIPLGIRKLSFSLARRLLAGEHLVLWGPIGSGKTTLLTAIESRVLGRPCGRTVQTQSLDDVGHVGTAMKSFLRRLRGGIAGMMLAVDVDSPRERGRLRAQHLGCQTLRMPPLEGKAQRALLETRWAARELPTLSVTVRRQLIRLAYGRPGWIIACVDLARDRAYWRGNTAQSAVLALDTELRLRTSKRALVGVLLATN